VQDHRQVPTTVPGDPKFFLPLQMTPQGSKVRKTWVHSIFHISMKLSKSVCREEGKRTLSELPPHRYTHAVDWWTWLQCRRQYQTSCKQCKCITTRQNNTAVSSVLVQAQIRLPGQLLGLVTASRLD